MTKWSRFRQKRNHFVTDYPLGAGSGWDRSLYSGGKIDETTMTKVV